MLRIFIGKLHKRFSVLTEDEYGVPTELSVDVREGHLAVVAIKGLEKKRFIVKIERLNDPSFRMLLEQTELEYGFDQTGTLIVPCTPQELEKILMSSIDM